MMLTIGITGGSGFLGGYVLRRLAEAGDYHVKAVSRTMRADVISALPNVSWMRGDLASDQVCRDFVQDLDVILHFAHTNTPLTSDRHLPSDASLNLIPTLALLEAIREAKTQPHLIYASSGGAIYGRPSERTPFRETDDCRPCSSYGIQKLAGEHYIRIAAEKGWLCGTCLRIANPYGVVLPSERKQGFIGVILNQLANRQPLTIFGNRSNVRDYLHLEDLYSMIAGVLARKTRFEIFNVGTGVGHSVDDIIGLLKSFHGEKLEISDISSEVDAHDLSPWTVLDVSKSAACLGWRPKINFEQGLQDVYRAAMSGAVT